MSADAIARLRGMVATADDGRWDYVEEVPTDDLRALLDHAALIDEALDALGPLYRKNKLREGYCLDTMCPHCNELRAAETVLAKAGRR